VPYHQHRYCRQLQTQARNLQGNPQDAPNQFSLLKSEQLSRENLVKFEIDDVPIELNVACYL
jgi:hypothetical protein